MNIEYFKWWSPSLHQDMEMNVYGHDGKPILVFPAQGGKFYEFSDFKMINAIQWFIDNGLVQVFTVDSIDNQSWANKSVHPAQRAARHQDYDKYIVNEVVPFINNKNPTDKKILTTGSSMGGYHSGNFFFRHPDVFDSVIALSGLFQLQLFIGDYMDDNVYFNSPISYLSNMNDEWFLEKYRNSNIIICAGQGAWEDNMKADAMAVKSILESKGVDNWIQLWGHDVNHDWPWWRKQLPYFLSALQDNGRL
jgi:esterase/lipase superfamily enzyme